MQTITDDVYDFCDSKPRKRKEQIIGLLEYLFKNCFEPLQLNDIAKGTNLYRHEQQLIRDLDKLCVLGMLAKSKEIIQYKRSPTNKKKENTFYKFSDEYLAHDFSKKACESDPHTKELFAHTARMHWFFENELRDVGGEPEYAPENFIKDKLMPVKEELEYFFSEILSYPPESKIKITVEYGFGDEYDDVNVVEIP